MIEVLGEFGGVELSPLRLEQLLTINVKKKYLIEDYTSCVHSAWFDYRLFSPAHMFMYFSKLRFDVTRKLLGENNFLLKDRPKKFRGILGKALSDMTEVDVFDQPQADITSMWKAKQAADSFGIPYEYFIQNSIIVAMDTLCTKPVAASVWYGERRLIKVIDLWNDYKRTNVRTAKHPFYTVEQYDNHPYQNEYRDHLIETIHRRDRNTYLLADLVYHQKHLPEDLVEKEFGREELKSAYNQYMNDIR